MTGIIDILGLVIDRATGEPWCGTVRITADSLALFRPGREDGEPLALVALPPATVDAIRDTLLTAIRAENA